MDQQLALEILLSGKNALLTGAAGAGKTYTLNQFIKHARDEGKMVSVTATTGLAATHLGGSTIHAWSGIGIHDSLSNNFFKLMSKGRQDIIKKTDVLIIDEISMLHDYRLDMIDEICRTVREEDAPFGGIQLVMCGDFFQLPPINRGQSRGGGFVTQSLVWQELEPVILYLSSQHRQDDEALLDILNSMRAGDIRRHHAETLMNRVDDTPPEGLELTELHTVNIDVDSINAQRLEQLSGDTVTYQSHTTGAANYVETLRRSVLAPEVLQLKKGAFVMAVRNASDKKYVNGSIGKVVDFEPVSDYPVVEFQNGKTITLQPETWELRDGDKKRASISQVPLRLAWAITVHKSQGMTLDAARIDLRKAFVPGMGYVALSRVKNLDNLYLVGINRTALQVSEDALAINEYLETLSAQACQTYEHLREQAEKRAKKASKTPKTTSKNNSWQEKIAKMRETHPNAYKPWTNHDDAILKQEFQNGKNIAALSTLLGRHEGSIKMRLQKHFGEDVVS